MNALRLLGLSFIVLLLNSCEPDKAVTRPVQDVIKTEQTAPISDKGINETKYDPERDVWQRPNLIIGLLSDGDLSDKTVADIGAGTGFFSKRLVP